MPRTKQRPSGAASIGVRAGAAGLWEASEAVGAGAAAAAAYAAAVAPADNRVSSTFLFFSKGTESCSNLSVVCLNKSIVVYSLIVKNQHHIRVLWKHQSSS